jgi:hypothetical protein
MSANNKTSMQVQVVEMTCNKTSQLSGAAAVDAYVPVDHMYALLVELLVAAGLLQACAN